MAPNPLAELRAAHPELAISDPPTADDWREFGQNGEWREKHRKLREEKRKHLEEVFGGEIPEDLCW